MSTSVALTDTAMLPSDPAFQFCSWGPLCDLSQFPKIQPLLFYLGYGPWGLMGTGRAVANPSGWRETEAWRTQSLQLVGIWKPD